MNQMKNAAVFMLSYKFPLVIAASPGLNQNGVFVVVE